MRVCVFVYCLELARSGLESSFVTWFAHGCVAVVVARFQGMCGFKGARKSTTYAARVVAQEAAKVCTRSRCGPGACLPQERERSKGEGGKEALNIVTNRGSQPILGPEEVKKG